MHLHFITIRQFRNDIIWVFGALQGALKSRCKLIVKEHEKTQDGLCVWHKFLQAHRFDGNVSLYVQKQKEVLSQKHHPHCPGGATQFLEEHEEAYTGSDYVLEHTNELDCTQFYTDLGKRETFITNFSLENYTAELITTIEGRTKTWSEMVSELRTHLARRTTTAITTARRKANQMEHIHTDTFMPHTDSQPSSIVPNPVDHTATAHPSAKAQHILAFLENSSCDQVDAFVCRVASDWNVGNQLWPHLPQQLRDQIVSIRNTARNGVSGGIPPQNNQNGTHSNTTTNGNTNTGATLNKTSKDVVKAPANSPPKQHSANMAR